MGRNTLVLSLVIVFVLFAVNGTALLNESLTDYYDLDADGRANIGTDITIASVQPTDEPGLMWNGSQGFNDNNAYTTGQPFHADNDWSTSVWLNTTQDCTTSQSIIQDENPSYSLELTLTGDNSKCNVTVTWYDAAWKTYRGGINISQNGWYHLVVVRDSTNLTIFVNGTKDSSFAISNGDNSASTRDEFGGNPASSAHGFVGNLDEWAIWSKALNDTEVTWLWNDSSGITYPLVDPSPTNQAPTLTINSPSNITKTYINQNTSIFNVTVDDNEADPVNVTIVVINSTNTTYNAAVPVTIPYNATGLTEGIVQWYVNVSDGINSYRSPETGYYNVTVDFTLPAITINSPNLDNTSVYWENTSLNVTIADDNLYLIWVNVTQPNGTNVLSRQINASSLEIDSYNINDTINNTEYGTYTVRIDASDSHTSKLIPKYEVIKSHDKLKYGNESKYVEIRAADSTLFSSTDTTKYTDRYNFEFKRSSIKSSKSYDDFYVEVDSGYIDIIRESNYLGHLVIKQGSMDEWKWVDFETTEKYRVDTYRESDTKVKVRVYGDKDKDYIFKSIGGLNTNNRTVTYVFNASNITYNETYDSSVNQGGSYTLLLNYTHNTLTKFEGLANNIILQYNGTNYTANYNFIDNLTNATATVTAPSTGANNDLIYHKWFINLTYKNGTQVVHSTVEVNQTLNVFTFDNCTNATSKAISFLIFNESSINSAVTATFLIDASYTSHTGATGNLNYELTGASNYTFCMNPSNATYNVDFIIQYYTDGVDTREWVYINYSINNTSQTENLYVLDESLSTAITIHIIDDEDNDLQDVMVAAYKYDLGNGTSIMVQSGFTDVDGEIEMDLNSEDNFYSFKLYTDGVLQKTTILEKIVGTSLEFTIYDLRESRYAELIQIRKMDTDITYNNQTQMVTFTWSDMPDNAATINLTIFTDNQTYYADSSTNTTGSLMYKIIRLNETYYVVAIATTDSGHPFIVEVKTIDTNQLWRSLEEEGIIYAFLIFLVLTLAGLPYPEVSIALGGASVILITVLGIVPATQAGMLWGVSLAIISIVALVKNR